MLTQDADPALRPGLSEIIGAIQPEAGLFVLEQDEAPLATAICVHDGDLAGLFEIATAAAERGKGHGRRLLLSALKWARLRGRAAGLAAGRGRQFRGRAGSTKRSASPKLYRYHYRRRPEA